MANVKACLVQDSRSSKNYDHTLIAPIRHNRFQQLRYFLPFLKSRKFYSKDNSSVWMWEVYKSSLGLKNIDLWKQVWADQFFFLFVTGEPDPFYVFFCCKW